MKKLSFISNIGTLLEKGLNKQNYWDNQQLEPLGLYSHSDQTQQWQTSLPDSRSSIGWGGRIADLMSSLNTNDKISMNISLSGNNVFQTGTSSVEYALDPVYGSMGIYGYRENDYPDEFDRAKNKAIDNMLDAHYADVFKKTYVDVIKTSRDANVQFSEAIADVPYMGDLFVDNELSNSMHMIAKTIAARESLGMKRQIFFVDYGGWDHHDELLNSQAAMLDELSNSMFALNAALERIGAQDCVTTFTASEFGRTLTWNGNGTDHGWGGNIMIMGGPVRGGQLYGDYPTLELDSNIDMGGGVLIPSLSVDEYYAELALWFGVQPSELSTILPNVGRFYDVNSGSMPIGFMI